MAADFIPSSKSPLLAWKVFLSNMAIVFYNFIIHKQLRRPFDLQSHLLGQILILGKPQKA